ncbi:putative bifunctional diguanylate cyclase/phosphodiesterase [Actinoplanes sp. NPDC049265]|uniref:putative bifunctional diguanylate cyclase/phosphodiesterase n=1 Tax=Actinoplanes sp. NPDC049265 TaxID=3363902 RepID=UPI003716D79B
MTLGRRDRATIALYAVTVLGVAWCAALALLGREIWPVAGTLLMVANHLISAAIIRRVSGSAALSPAARRYWRTVAGAVAAIGLALLVRPAGRAGVPGAAAGAEAIHALGAIMLAWALIRLPFGAGRGFRLALALDFAITATAAATVFLHIAGWDSMHAVRHSAAGLATIVAFVGVTTMSVFVAVKVVLTGDRTLSRCALRRIGAASLIGGGGSAVGTALGGPAGQFVLLAVIPVAGCLIALAARRHLADARTMPQEAPRRRTYSLLPYLSIAVVDGLLIHTIVADDADKLAVALFAVALTGLVVLRQLHTFRVNDRLIRQLDAGLVDLRDAQERLSHEASHDALTGLANRVLFGDRVTACLRGLDGDRACSVVLIDLDDFKTVNDTLGHAAGDALLAAVAERLRAGVRPSDTVARLGGDEFAILFEGVGAEHVDRVLQRIAESLLAPVAVEERLLSVRASFGVAAGRAGDDAGELLRRADVAMYEAKHRGEGGHQHYTDGMESRAAERARRAAALRAALDNDEFELFYQPQVALPGGEIVGAEALIRWNHPSRGLLGPAEFIDDAEQSKLIVPLGAWVIAEACRQAAAWRSRPGAPSTVSVNVSAHQLQEPGLALTVAEALTAAYLPAEALTVEITESAAVGGGATRQNLQDLRELGVRIALDDFGTGASSLSLLHACPVDEVKLDRSFVPGASFIPGTVDDAIARAVLQLAHAFGLSTVAEGVETAEQAAYLAELGYHSAQGFYYARPVPARELGGDRVVAAQSSLEG